MRVHIDTTACTGHGRCYSLAPEVYEADDDGYGRVRDEVVPPEAEAKAMLGVHNCPEGAITVVAE